MDVNIIENLMEEQQALVEVRDLNVEFDDHLSLIHI